MRTLTRAMWRAKRPCISRPMKVERWSKLCFWDGVLSYWKFNTSFDLFPKVILSYNDIHSNLNRSRGNLSALASARPQYRSGHLQWLHCFTLGRPARALHHCAHVGGRRRPNRPGLSPGSHGVALWGHQWLCGCGSFPGPRGGLDQPTASRG